MRYNEELTAQWGRVLWLRSENAELAVALDFGIRIVHASYPGMENLFYEQPNDLSDGFVEKDGWRLYGGHRMWLAPESTKSYYPDNQPVSYEITDGGVLVTQPVDPWMQIQKRLRIDFQEDGSVRVEQSFENISDAPMIGAAWGVNTLDAGGRAVVSFDGGNRGEFNPHRVVSLWADTSLHDPRLYFAKDHLVATHIPSRDYLKIGLYSNPGKAVFENKGQRFTLTYDAQPLECYADNGCNFELYMCMQFMELESLGVNTEILPGQSAVHVETWKLEPCTDVTGG